MQGSEGEEHTEIGLEYAIHDNARGVVFLSGVVI